MLPHHTLFFNSFAADAHVGEQVRFGDPVGTSHFQTADRSRTEQLVAGLGADAENLADLFHAHDVGVFPEHELVSIALGHSRYAHFVFPPIMAVSFGLKTLNLRRILSVIDRWISCVFLFLLPGRLRILCRFLTLNVFQSLKSC